MRILFFVLLSAFFFYSCKNVQEQKSHKTSGYFSIKDFTLDQWKTYHGQPFGMQKFVYMNGKKDSVLTNADAVDWGAIFRIFFETDISAPKFIDKYESSMFEDSATNTVNFYYEAKDAKLVTQKLSVMVNATSKRVVSVYIETLGQNNWGSRIQRLYYEPIKVISIQEFETVATGNKKEIRVEYRFL